LLHVNDLRLLKFNLLFIALLAERLLYLPSIGFCILFVIGLNRLLFYFKLIVEKEIKATDSSNVHKGVNLLFKSLFWGFICLTIGLYYSRLQVFLPLWKNDRILFENSLRVCPNSAKMNLQVARMYLDELNIEKAEHHISRAAEIDPDFCDVGYQKGSTVLELFISMQLIYFY
jgi:hypothetical protein